MLKTSFSFLPSTGAMRSQTAALPATQMASLVQTSIASDRFIPQNHKLLLFTGQHTGATERKHVNAIMDQDAQNTWLHYAVIVGDTPLAEELLQQPAANIGLKNKAGYTAYTLCAVHGELSIAELLHRKHAQIQAWQLKDEEIEGPSSPKYLYPSKLAEIRTESLHRQMPDYAQRKSDYEKVIQFFKAREQELINR